MALTFTYEVEFKYCRLCAAVMPHELRPCEGCVVKICAICLILKLGLDVTKYRKEQNVVRPVSDHQPDLSRMDNLDEYLDSFTVLR